MRHFDWCICIDFLLTSHSMFLFRWCDKLSYLYLGKFNKKNVYFINFEDCDQAEQCSRGVSLFSFLIVVLVSQGVGDGLFC